MTVVLATAAWAATSPSDQAWFRADGNTSDADGNWPALTWSGTPAFVAAPDGSAFGFSGANGLASPDASLGDLGTRDFIMQVDVNTTGVMESILTKLATCSVTAGWRLEIREDLGPPLPVLVLLGPNGVSAPFTKLFANRGVSDGRWHTLTYQRSGTTLSVMVDGTAAGSTSVSPSLDVSNAATLGVAAQGYPCLGIANQSGFTGAMDNIYLGTGPLTDLSLVEPTVPVVDPGKAGAMTVNLVNPGPATVPQTTLAIDPPAGVTFVSTVGPGCTVVSAVARCSGPLPAGTTPVQITFTVNASAGPGSTLTTTATQLSNDSVPDPNHTNDTGVPIRVTVGGVAPTTTTTTPPTTTTTTTTVPVPTTSPPDNGSQDSSPPDTGPTPATTPVSNLPATSPPPAGPPAPGAAASPAPTPAATPSPATLVAAAGPGPVSVGPLPLDQALSAGLGIEPIGPPPALAQTQPPPVPTTTPGLLPASPPTTSATGANRPQAAGPAPSAGAPRPVAAPAVESDLVDSVTEPRQVSFDPVLILQNLLIASGGILLVAFPGELFNQTLTENYDDIMGWFRRGPFSWMHERVNRLSSWTVLLGLAPTAALIYSLLSPDFGWNRASLNLYVGFLIALPAVTAAYYLTCAAFLRRRYDAPSHLNGQVVGLFAAALLVVVSRAVGFHPGYIYCTFTTLAFTARRPTTEEYGRGLAIAALVLGVVSLAAWLLLGPVASRAMAPGAREPILVLDSTLAVMWAAGLGTIVFGLAPIRFFDGALIRQWSARAWLVIYGVAVFVFLHVIVNPKRGYYGRGSNTSLVEVLGLFIGFGVFSVAFWGYFRFRADREGMGGGPPEIPAGRA